MSPRELLRRVRPRDGHDVARLGLLLVCAFFAVRGWGKAVRPGGNDFTIYWEAGRAVLAGRDPLAVEGYLYLPSFATLIAPLAALPYAVAAALWQALSYAALLVCLSAVSALVRGALPRPPRTLEWLPLLVALRLVDSNFANGQANLLVLAALLAGLGWLSRGRATLAGAAVALAAALKVLPAVFLGLWLVRGSRRAALRGAACLALLVLAVPAPLLGWRGNLESLHRFGAQVARPYVAGGERLITERGYLPGQSLTASGYRLLVRVPARHDGTPANLLDLEPATAEVVLRALALLHVALAAVVAGRRAPAPGSSAWLHEASLVLCLTVLLAPIAHKAHLIWMLPPWALLLAPARLPEGRARGAARRSLIGLSVILVAGTTPWLVGRAAATGFLSHNALFLGVEAAFLALLLDPRARR